PRDAEPAALEVVGRSAAVVAGEHPATPDGRGREEIGARWRRDRLQLAALVRRGAAHLGDAEEPDQAVLPALREIARAQDRGRRGAEVDVAGVELRRVRGRVVADDLRRV